jgi:hypothetical protein
MLGVMSDPDTSDHARRPRSSGSPNRSRGEFLNRLGIYLLGVSIGLVMVGMIWMARSRQMAAAGGAAPASAPSPSPGRVP